MERSDGFHSLAEARSWALHEAVADLLPQRPDLIQRAKHRVAGWLCELPNHPYALEWKALLDGEVHELQRALVGKDSRMCTLRQASPFAGALDSSTRWSILKRRKLRPGEAS